MAFDYTELRDDTVEPLLAEFGKSGFLYRNAPSNVLVDRNGAPIVDRDGNFIVVRDTVPWGSQLDVEVPYPVTLLQTMFKKSDNSGTLVEVGDVLFLVSTKGVTIDPGLAERIAANDVTYQVIRIDPLQPGSVVMLWKIHARK